MYFSGGWRNKGTTTSRTTAAAVAAFLLANMQQFALLSLLSDLRVVHRQRSNSMQPPLALMLLLSAAMVLQIAYWIQCPGPTFIFKY